MFLNALIVLRAANACIHFTMPEVDGDFVLGRSMEFEAIFPTSMWQMRTHPVGEPLGFSETYGFVGMDARIPIKGKWGNLLDMTAEGMNSEGLTASMLVLRESKYQPRATTSTDTKIEVPYFELTPFILGRYATVNETLDAIRDDLRVVDPFPGAIPDDLYMHWAIADAKGDYAVVEYLEGKPSITLNGVGVLTNGPDLEWQLRNLNYYSHLSPDPVYINKGMKVQSNTEVGVVPSIGAHGSNLLGMPGDYTPAARFVRTFYLRQIALVNQPPKSTKDSIAIATSILDNMMIIPGTATNKKPSKKEGIIARLFGKAYDFTQFDALKLPKSKTYMFRTYENHVWKAVNVDQLDLTEGATAKSIEMYDGTLGIEDITQDLA